MALGEVQQIIEILRNAQQQKLAQQELDQRKAEQEARANQNLMEQDQRDKAFQEQIKQHEAQNKIAQQAADLQLKVYKLHGAQALQEIGQKYQETGVAPGGQVAPMATSSTGGDFSPINPQQATGAQLTIPGMEDLGSIQVATPERAAARQAGLDRIAMRPKVEAKIEESRALQADLLNKQDEAKSADFQRAAMMKVYDDERMDKKIKADAEQARLDRLSRERIANITKGGIDELDLTPIAQDAIEGKTSLEAINKLGISKLKKTQLINAVTGAGARILSQKQMDLVGDFSQLVNAIPYMDEIIRQQPQTTNYLSSKLGGVASTFDTQLRASEKELDARASVVARFLREKGNLSNQDITRVMGLFPSRFDTVDVNIKKRDDFAKELTKIIDSQLDNVSPAQRNIIKKRVGLLDIGLYGSQSKQVGTPNATHIWTPNGIQPVGAK